MNRSFQSIWNQALGAWVAASETCTARGKKSSSTLVAAGLVAAGALAAASPAWAVDECGAVLSGGTVTCQGDGTPVGDANPNTTGIFYNTDNIKVVVDGTANPLTIAAPNAHGVFSSGSGAGNQQIEVNGPVRITLVTPSVSSIWGVLARTLGGTGNATAVINGAKITATGNNAHGVATTIFGDGNATSILNSGSISTTGTGGSAVALFAETRGIGTATATMNGGSINTGSATGGSHATYALARGNGDAFATMTGGVGTTLAANNAVVVAQTEGSGDAHALLSGGTATASGSTPVIAAFAAGSGDAFVEQTGGAVIANGANSFGLYAGGSGTGSANALMTGGSIRTTGGNASGIQARSTGVSGAGSTTLTMTGGTVETVGDNTFAAYARTSGLGAVTVLMSGGSIATSGRVSNGLVGAIENAANASNVNVTMADGRIVSSGAFSGGLRASTSGSGNSTATVTGGSINTSGDGTNSFGIQSFVVNPASTGTAAAVLQGGSLTTTGSGAPGIAARSLGSGLSTLQMSGGTVAATGLNSDGLWASSSAGTYDADVTGGTVTSGSGVAAAIHTTAAGGGTIDVGAAATLNGAASGIAIRDGDLNKDGTDETGGNAIVATAGTVTGDAILGLGNDSLALTGGSYTGNIYGDDRVASAGDGNDTFTWTGGTLSGGFYGQNGSDTALVSAAGYNGSQVLDGGDDVSAADGWVDKLTLQGVTATAGGAQLANWESITLDNTRLTLAGAPLVVGSGADANGAPMGLFIQPTSSVFMGQPAFAITGDVHNAGLIDLRNSSGVPGNALTVNGNYAGNNGLVRLNTALGGDASATDKLVVNGNTSGTTRVLVANTGGAGAATINGIQVVQVSGTSSEGNFTLAAPVQAGAYEYGLHRGGRTDGDANSFYLSSVYDTPVSGMQNAAPTPAPEVLRPAVPGYVMGQVATQELGLGLLGTLHQRVGEQQTFKWDHCGCDDKAPTDQAWMRLHAQRLDLDGKRQFGFEQEMQYFQLGKDLAIRYSGNAGDKSRSHTGISAGYGRTSTNFNDRRRGEAGMGYDTGKMKGQMLTLGAYHTRYADNGSYLDLVGQLHAVQNKYTDKYGGQGTQKGTGGGLSAEVGRPWQIGDSQWLIEPQAQLSYQLTRYRGFADNISSVDGFTSHSLRGRVGARLAWNDKAERGEKLTRTNTFYVTANVLHEFKDPKGVTIGNTTVNEEWAKQTWAELGVGAQLPLSKAAYLYGGVQYQRSLSGAQREGVSGQLGVRVAW
jgi:outer membrane autotransporter protein